PERTERMDRTGARTDHMVARTAIRERTVIPTLMVIRITPEGTGSTIHSSTAMADPLSAALASVSPTTALAVGAASATAMATSASSAAAAASAADLLQAECPAAGSAAAGAHFSL